MVFLTLVKVKINKYCDNTCYFAHLFVPLQPNYTEQKLQKEYVQTVIDAGKEVNKAVAQCQAAREKHGYYQRQVQVLHEAYTATHYLMESGQANYLEVLTAQESFLSAQLSEASNLYDGAQAIIALYIALGGGTK